MVVLVLKVVMGLGFVAAGTVKELVMVVGHILGIFILLQTLDLGCCDGCGGCWGTWLLPWVWVGVGGVWEKKNSFFNNTSI
jgi:hypothetical protein